MVEITLEGSILSPDYAGVLLVCILFHENVLYKRDLPTSYFFAVAPAIRYLSYHFHAGYMMCFQWFDGWIESRVPNASHIVICEHGAHIQRSQHSQERLRHGSPIHATPGRMQE